jgi:NADH dehydrogenase FAD-containing subunit
MESLGVNVIYNDRIHDVDAFEQERDKHVGRMMSVTLRSGRVVDSDLQILAIGQRHNHELLSCAEPTLLSSESSLKVLPTLQLDHPDWSHVFAIGDVAQTGAIKAGYMGLAQADVASSNIVELAQGGGRGSERNLKSYEPAKPEIKVTVGLVSWTCPSRGRIGSGNAANISLEQTTMVSQRIGGDGNYEWSTSKTPKDLHAAFMWSAYGADPTDMTL